MRRSLALLAAVAVAVGAGGVLGAYTLRGAGALVGGAVVGAFVGMPARRLCPGDLLLAAACGVCAAGAVAAGTWSAFAHRWSQLGPGSWAGVAVGALVAWGLALAPDRWARWRRG